jgi:predicted transposase/invertase (TIGR01784 family)
MDLAQQEKLYATIRSVYGIFIMKKNFSDDPAAVNHWGIYNRKTHVAYPAENRMHWTTVEIEKPLTDEEKNVLYWIDFFRTGEVSDNAPDYLKRAKMLLDEALRKREVNEMAKSMAEIKEIRELEMEYAVEEGIKKGIEKGELRVKVSNANEMFRLGLSFDIVKQVTKLDDQTLRDIQQKN